MVTSMIPYEFLPSRVKIIFSSMYIAGIIEDDPIVDFTNTLNDNKQAVIDKNKIEYNTPWKLIEKFIIMSHRGKKSSH